MNNKAVIESTSDYSKFKFIDANRKVSKTHVTRLVATLKLFPKQIEWTPILVNEKFQIADGQHRFTALKELKLPIYYMLVRGLTIEDARRLNAGAKPWSPMDFAECFCQLGKDAYCFYVKLKLNFQKKLNHDVLMRFIQLGPITTEAFKQGFLDAPDKQKTKELCAAAYKMWQITGNNHRGLAFALQQIHEEGRDLLDVTSAVEKFYKSGKAIEPYKDTDEYYKALQKIIR